MPDQEQGTAWTTQCPLLLHAREAVFPSLFQVGLGAGGHSHADIALASCSPSWIHPPLRSLHKPGRPPALVALLPSGAMEGPSVSPLPMWALALKPDGLVSSSPVAWKASSNEQPERAPQWQQTDAAVTAQQLCHMRAASSALGAGQGIGTAVDPVLSCLGKERALGAGEECFWVAQRSPSCGAGDTRTLPMLG